MTSIDLNAYRNLVKYLGFDEDPWIDDDPFHQRLLIAWASEDVLRNFGSDCRDLTLKVYPKWCPRSPSARPNISTSGALPGGDRSQGTTLTLSSLLRRRSQRPLNSITIGGPSLKTPGASGAFKNAPSI